MNSLSIYYGEGLGASLRKALNSQFAKAEA
jgi:hypothetical protein